MKPWNEEPYKTDTRKRLGRRIREEREKKGYTIEELAAKIGITPNNLDRCENGRFTLNETMLAYIAEVLDCELDIVSK